MIYFDSFDESEECNQQNIIELPSGYYLEDYCDKFNKNAINDILNLCFDYCDCFSFSIYAVPKCDVTLQEALEPYVKQKLTVTRWFCYHLFKNYPLDVCTYELNDNTKKLLKEHYKYVFLPLHPGKPGYGLPSVEDLCFFKNDKLIFGTVSHESICQAYPPDEEFAKRFLEIDSHLKYMDDDDEQIDLNNIETV
ncbi:MAG: hypothetical protein HFE63_00220 [Clostridiales bacterium]|nr:hypothetical protein [Clostridiales bacterium]